MEEGATPGIVRELKNDFSRKLFNRFPVLFSANLWWDKYFFTYFRPLVSIMILVTAPFLLAEKKLRSFTIICLLNVLYSAFIVSMAANVLDRVVFQMFLVELMLAVTGMCFLIDKGKKVKGKGQSSRVKDKVAPCRR
jgi:hypothetical protein